MKTAYIGFGSNLGNRERILQWTRENISCEEVTLIKESSVYESEPVIRDEEMMELGGEAYLNAVFEIETSFEPKALLQYLRDLENQQGRERSYRDAPRTLDLDILLYEDEIVKEEGLEIPHKNLHERAFVLIPLAEIASDKMHPILRKTILSLRDDLSASQKSEVGKYHENY